MVIQGLQNFLSLLIPIIHLDLLVLVSDQRLHIDAFLTGNSQHDAALVRQLLLRDLGLLNLKLLPLLVLAGPHLAFSNDCCLKFLQVCA